mmetsp:Transcript_28705/g.60075  ORF Transcript_28705/g.60075 Transcript_28705/m.60075 type:complete len:211 (-) Transcript_28705:890-1522(-)
MVLSPHAALPIHIKAHPKGQQGGSARLQAEGLIALVAAGGNFGHHAPCDEPELLKELAAIVRPHPQLAHLRSEVGESLFKPQLACSFHLESALGVQYVLYRPNQVLRCCANWSNEFCCHLQDPLARSIVGQESIVCTRCQGGAVGGKAKALEAQKEGVQVVHIKVFHHRQPCRRLHVRPLNHHAFARVTRSSLPCRWRRPPPAPHAEQTC